MTKSYLRGHEIEYTNNDWRYSDTKESTAETYKTRPCGMCGKKETKEGHDACLGTLPSIMNACCSHGVLSSAYVQFLSGRTITGYDVLKIIEILKKYR